MRAAAVAVGVVLLGCQRLSWNWGRYSTPELVEQHSGVTADLRGVAAVHENTAWASGTGGTWLRTADAGRTWTSGVVPGAEQLDLRSLAAFDERRALVLSAGSPARMFRTADGGASWRELYRNDDPGIFFDALRFADESRGYALADPVAGRFVLLETTDAGATWTQLSGPESIPGEGAFAASNSALAVRGDFVWFGTGGTAARVFRSPDRGRTWSAVRAPVPSGGASKGVFSIAFVTDLRGALVGGDYQAPYEPGDLATTEDGGMTWTSGEPTPGYRSSVVFLGGIRLIATGTSGTDSAEIVGWWRRRPTEPGSSDTNGWGSIGAGFNALSRWCAVGPKGRVARIWAGRRGP